MRKPSTERELIAAGLVADIPRMWRCLCDRGRRGECRRNQFCAEQTARLTEPDRDDFFPANWSRIA